MTLNVLLNSHTQAWNSNDSRVAKRMALLVFTDFACWAPIAFFSLTAAFGYDLISLNDAKVIDIVHPPPPKKTTKGCSDTNGSSLSSNNGGRKKPPNLVLLSVVTVIMYRDVTITELRLCLVSIVMIMEPELITSEKHNPT